MTKMQRPLMAMCMATTLGLGANAFAESGGVAVGQMDKKDMMTVTGCVMAGKDSGMFMLTNAMSMAMMDKPMMDQEKMKSDRMQKDMMMSYELVGGTNLKAHLGHKVEVMGTMAKMDMDNMMKMKKMDQMAKDKMMSDKDMKAMKLNVTSVKMVSATCP